MRFCNGSHAIVFARLEKDVDFEALDDQPVDLVARRT
ncbi:MAG: Phosphotransferase system mannitol/fructose-specific IIA domain (Ntr-type) [Candidatus Tokpelaia sp. JSC085]|nr:MAG: Phosphotransferase system mannitol/fructose-specific IIA domain (Ntr-type) [Candidatus Tokpelaia sp. JSC085]